MNTKIIIGLFTFTFLIAISKAQKNAMLPSKHNSVTAVPLYRLVDPYGYHFYTTNEAEKNATIKDLGYKDEGIIGYVFPQKVLGSVPLYRYRSEFSYIINNESNQAVRIARHFYTSNQNDEELKPKSWNYGIQNGSYTLGNYISEGIQCYVSSSNVENLAPVYWLYKDFCAFKDDDHDKMVPGAFDNLYTNNEEEKFSAVYKFNYKQKSIAFYVWKTAISK
ncbi:MAG: hypothetical protein JST10_09810 [Bacteroidetes bacterium]|nr:hypothetical protein [Bacteroidota bacterium]MBS1632855.1 hypothetical protein [Bacteroidota bacterium]